MRTVSGLATTLLPALALASVAAMPSPAAATPVNFPGDTIDSAVASPDGTVRFTSAGSGDGGPHATLLESGPDGTLLPPRTLLAPARLQTAGNAALTPTGAVVVYRTLRRPHPRVRAFDVDAAGHATAAQTLSLSSTAARPIGEIASANGSVAVTFEQHLRRGGWQPRLAFRTAGATRFAPSVATGRPTKGNGDSYDTVVLAPDGTGALINGPRGVKALPVTVRRIAVDGTLGPVITLAAGPFNLVGVAAKFSPAGTLVAALDTIADRATGRRAFGLVTTTLPAGASTPTPLVKIGPGGDSSVQAENLGLDVTTGDRVLIVSGAARPNRIRVLGGPATAPAEVGSFPFANPFSATASFTADGGAAVFWSGNATSSGQSGVYGSQQAPGGTFPAATAVVAPAEANVELRDAVPLPDGRTAIIYTANAGLDGAFNYLDRVRP